MIPINKPWLGTDEKSEILSVLDDGILTSAAKDGGKRVRDFEFELRNFLKVKHVVAVNSGTAALYAALLAADIKKDDEILLPSFTFVATANSVAALGARPVFVDINTQDYTLDISDLKSKITTKSKAIIPVHLYGHPSDIDEIVEIANKHSLDVIEDACQSVGSTYKHKQTGTIGLMGCFSMYASKVLTCGEGGAIATNSDNIAEKLRMIRNHGMVEGYDTRVFGLNLRLPELSAAIAKVQTKRLPTMLSARRSNAELMSKTLVDASEKLKITIKLPTENENKRFNWYLYTIAFEDNITRDKAKRKMLEKGIGATVYYDPAVHQTPYYSKMVELSSERNNNNNGKNLVKTEQSSRQVLSLPVHPLVKDEDIENIGNIIKEID
jgi:dTDP-4-amino-4,6-dideoxygalactose transaminase